MICRIRKGRSGACDRYGNVEGVLMRLDRPDFDQLLREPLVDQIGVDDAVQRVASGALTGRYKIALEPRAR